MATFGPCTKMIAAESWLCAEGEVDMEGLALFRAG